MLERTQMLVEALCRAATGVATSDDWNTICTECGVPKASIFKLTGENYGIDSERQWRRQLYPGVTRHALGTVLPHCGHGHADNGLPRSNQALAEGDVAV